MFCPKCGSQNPEETAYCRACGEDLKIVSQAMKKNSPVALISKLDAAIERKNERFRRNAIFMGVFGAIFAAASIIFAVLPLSSDFMTFIFPGMAIMLLGFSIWYTLVFFRSGEIPIGKDRRPPAAHATDKTFCPACGTRNRASTGYCRTCGQSLIFGNQGLERYLPAFVVRRLDAAVANEKDLEGAYRQRKWLWLLPVLYLWPLINSIVDREVDLFLLYLFVMISTVVFTGWDYLTYRRNLEKEVNQSPRLRGIIEASGAQAPTSAPLDALPTFLENPTVPIHDELSQTVPLARASPQDEQETVKAARKSFGTDEENTGRLDG